MRKVYFAHPIIDYNSMREEHAMNAIREYFGRSLQIINPNTPEHAEGYAARGEFAYWTDLAASCHDVAFLPMPGEDRPIGSGVFAEIRAASSAGRELYEINRLTFEISKVQLHDLAGRAMSIPDTRLVTKMVFDFAEGR